MKGKPLLQALALVAVIHLPFTAMSQTVTLNHLNASASLNLNDGFGMNSFLVEGQDQLFQQWFWYRVGNGLNAPINALGGLSWNQPAPNMLNTTYGNSLYSITVNYTLTGGQAGSGSAHLAESIVINNLSTAAYQFHFFQYSDFDLGGTPSADAVGLYGSPLGWTMAYQHTMPIIFEESITTATPATRGQVDLYPNLRNFIDGTANDLTGFAGPIGGDATWALEWIFNLAPQGELGSSYHISKDKVIRGVLIPEPATLTLAGVGLLFLRFLRRR